MDVFLITVAVLFSIIGLAGCILPGLPGPPFNYVAVLLIQWAFSPFSTNFLWITGAIVAVVTVLDYVLPLWVAKKFGATREGMIGSIIGLVVGLIFPPVGILVGLIAGAIIGDLIAGKKWGDAVYSGFGNALGTLFSTGFKLIVSGILTWYVAKAIFCYATGCDSIPTSFA